MSDFASQQAGILGLLIFFLFFIVMVCWLMTPKAKSDAEKNAKIPFKEDQ
jgi:cbb3-type cytochrome oxidase subunit 3